MVSRGQRARRSFCLRGETVFRPQARSRPCPPGSLPCPPGSLPCPPGRRALARVHPHTCQSGLTRSSELSHSDRQQENHTGRVTLSSREEMPERPCFDPLMSVRGHRSGSWLRVHFGLLGLKDGRGTQCFLTGLWSPPGARTNGVETHLFPDCSLLDSNLLGHWVASPHAVAAP